jgi:hypothetical protein
MTKNNDNAHRITSCPRKCPNCKQDYADVIRMTKNLRNEKVKEMLLDFWETLWLNNNSDWDIISEVFEFDILDKELNNHTDVRRLKNGKENKERSKSKERTTC